MERIEADLFTDPGNDAVVRLPGRRFPGVLIQGDSLSIMRNDAAELLEACQQGATEEALEMATMILEDFDTLLKRYTDALDAHGLAWPFQPRQQPS